jgi:pimeloyl-ACP methyl ester carboxylesterase
MPIVTRTQRLLTPPPDAPYIVQTVNLPPLALDIPAALLANIPAQHKSWFQQAAHEACPPATWLQPRDWSGAAVLLIPGAGDNRHAFKWLLFQHLLARRLAVLTLDPPGHGDFRTIPCTVENARRTAQTALDWLCAQAGVQRVGAIGISFGGCQVADLAARDPRITALALISTPVRLPPVTRWTVVREVLGLIYLPFSLMLRLPILLAEWRSVPSAWFGEGLYEMIARFDVLGAVRAVGSRPKLILHGTHDVAVPPANAQQIYDASLPERALLWVQRANHVGVALREDAMRALAGWLADHLLMNFQ